MLQHCTGCTTVYAAGLQACPHCRRPAEASSSVTIPTQEAPRTRGRRRTAAQDETDGAEPVGDD